MAVSAQQRPRKSPRAVSGHAVVAEQKEEGFCTSWHGIKKKTTRMKPEIACNYEQLALALAVSAESAAV